MFVIDVVDASFGYGETVAARGVTLRVAPGEVVALLGPNGSGKSTVVKGLLGLAATLGGRVELFGLPAADVAERWRIGYVPQRHTVAGAMPSTVAEVVASGRLARRRWWHRATAADRAAVQEAIAEVGLTERRDSPVATLSGGQQRRVLIARALAAQPEVLIMDEPTAGVDAENAERLLVTLRRLAAAGRTMLVVTHDLAPVREVLTRAVLMRDGRIVADSPVAHADWTAHHDVGGDGHHHLDEGPPGRRTEPGWLGDLGLRS